jgi:hypothetical protein
VTRAARGPRLTAAVVSLPLIAITLGACNAILDNTRGELVDRDEAGARPATSASPPVDAAAEAAEPDSGPTTSDAGESPTTRCPVGQKRCSGACVATTDPRYGCGDATCAPCAIAHGKAACDGRTCAVSQCNAGYADCNGAATDGCETELSKPASCGACGRACAAAAPLCTPSGATSFHCTNGCAANAPLRCGAECVDPLTSTSHCGGCNLPCRAAPNAASACVAGACTATCNPPFHACAGVCVANGDPKACGPGCTPCPVPPGGAATCVADTCGIDCAAPNRACGGRCTAQTDPTACGPACTACPLRANAAATCAADACGFTCNAGFGDCDAAAANGCEVTFESDPLHCGQCGKSCDGKACVLGVCQAAPPPPPPPPP